MSQPTVHVTADLSRSTRNVRSPAYLHEQNRYNSTPPCVSHSTPVQVTLKPSLSNTLASIIGGDKPPLICTVNHTEETLSVYQVARMPPQQLAILWQVLHPPYPSLGLPRFMCRALGSTKISLLFLTSSFDACCIESGMSVHPRLVPLPDLPSMSTCSTWHIAMLPIHEQLSLP